jgi:hypothetical protein
MRVHRSNPVCPPKPVKLEPLGNVLRVVVVIIAVLVVIGSCSISRACRSAAGACPPWSRRMSWSNPQVVGKVAGEEIDVAD